MPRSGEQALMCSAHFFGSTRHTRDLPYRVVDAVVHEEHREARGAAKVPLGLLEVRYGQDQALGRLDRRIHRVFIPR